MIRWWGTRALFNQTHLNTSGSARSTPIPISGWEYAYYAYDPAHPHAVATIERSAGPDHFVDDVIGDMTARYEAGVSWTQGFDEEGRLETINDSTDTIPLNHSNHYQFLVRTWRSGKLMLLH